MNKQSAGCSAREKTGKSMADTSESLRAAEPETNTNFDELNFSSTKKKKPKNRNRLAISGSIQTASSHNTDDFSEAPRNFATKDEESHCLYTLYTYSEVSYFLV